MLRPARLVAGVCAVALAATLGSARAADAPAAIVQTASGTVAGTGTDVHAFENIPFAAPPVGALR